MYMVLIGFENFLSWHTWDPPISLHSIQRFASVKVIDPFTS